MRGVVIALLLQLTLSSVTLGSVSIYIRQEKSSNNYRSVNFNSTMIQIMYKCMVNATSQTCVAHLDLGVAASHDQKLNAKVKSIDQIISQSDSDQSYFTCKYDQGKTTLNCTRNYTSNSSCKSFRLCTSTFSDISCVHLVWMYEHEAIIDDTNDNIQYCNTECDKTLSSMAIPNVCTLYQTSSVATTAINNATVQYTGHESSDNSPGAIAGIVCGVLVAIITAVVVGFLVYRRKKQQANSTALDSRHPRCHGDGTLTRATNNLSTIPDVLAALPDCTRENNTKEIDDDGYWMTDDDYGLKQYHNVTKTFATKNSQVPVEERDLSNSEHQAQSAEYSTPDTAVEREDICTVDVCVEKEYNCTADVDVRKEDNCAADVDGTIREDGGYSLAKIVNKAEMPDDWPQHTTDYSRFGEQPIVMFNPYHRLATEHETQ